MLILILIINEIQQGFKEWSKESVIRGWSCKWRNSSVVEMYHFEILFEMGKLHSYTRVQHVNYFGPYLTILLIYRKFHLGHGVCLKPTVGRMIASFINSFLRIVASQM